MIYTYENLFVAYFSINGRFCLVPLKNPTFSNIFPRAKHVLMTFEFWTLCACLCIFSLYIFHLLLSSQQATIDMWTISYPSPDDFIHIYFHIYIYIYIYMLSSTDSFVVSQPFSVARPAWWCVCAWEIERES